jgi:hypothetical protein
MLYTKAEVKANQEAWLADLENSKTRQVNATLVATIPGMKRTTYGYSCLGVAMKCLGYKRVGAQESAFGFAFKCGDHTETTELSLEARDKLGLESCSGAFDADSLPKKLRTELEIKHRFCASGKTSLVTLNDENVPFKMIAKVIRARPKGLFKKGYAFKW